MKIKLLLAALIMGVASLQAITTDINWVKDDADGFLLKLRGTNPNDSHFSLTSPSGIWNVSGGGGFTDPAPFGEPGQIITSFQAYLTHADFTTWTHSFDEWLTMTRKPITTYEGWEGDLIPQDWLERMPPFLTAKDINHFTFKPRSLDLSSFSDWKWSAVFQIRRGEAQPVPETGGWICLLIGFFSLGLARRVIPIKR